MVKFFDTKFYPEQKPKCLKLTKSYPEKKQYIDCAFSAFWCFFVLVKSYPEKNQYIDCAF